MKTVKFILPIVAIMAAVAGVFATGNSALVTNVDVTLINASTGCVKDGVCDTDITTKKCKMASGATLQRISLGSCTSTQVLGAFVADQPNNP